MSVVTATVLRKKSLLVKWQSDENGKKSQL